MGSVVMDFVTKQVPPEATRDLRAWLQTVGDHEVLPVQLHALALGTFASFVAPFGGFLASAIKRAYGVKDFDSYLPGHGGLTDRMDCQFLMALCTWVYLHSFVMDSSTVSGLFAHALLLEPAQQRELYDQLREHLVSTGVLLK